MTCLLQRILASLATLLVAAPPCANMTCYIYPWGATIILAGRVASRRNVTRRVVVVQAFLFTFLSEGLWRPRRMGQRSPAQPARCRAVRAVAPPSASSKVRSLCRGARRGCPGFLCEAVY